MERAGAYAFSVLRERWPSARRITAVCGTGNNGGDGFVLARLALEAGCEATIALVGDADDIRGDARLALERLACVGVRVQSFDRDGLAGADVVIDALLGIGLKRPLDGDYASAVSVLNSQPAPVLAMDVPTGLNADTGAVMGACVQCAATVTFVALKQGLLTGRAPAFTGRLYFADLGIAPAIAAQVVRSARWMGAAALVERLLPRARDAHKGDFGHVVVVGGAEGYAGAALMSARAAARAGAGLVSLVTHETHAAMVVMACLEVMVHGAGAPPQLGRFLDRATVLAAGPGLGQEAWGRKLFESVCRAPKPIVLDADGLNWLARLGGHRDDWILTPHPAEAGRLLGVSTATVQEDRFAVARAIAERFGGVCVLKGPGTVVDNGTDTVVVTTGNPGMASGGSGDVLTGVIAALLGQGLAAFDAATIGACWHGYAGDLAAADGERGMLATDVIEHLRRAGNP